MNKDLFSNHIVMSYELDGFGHVNNAVYLNYLEKARNDFMILKGLEFNDFFKWKKFPVLSMAYLEFKRPAKAGDRLIIYGEIKEHSYTSFTLEYEIFLKGTEILVLKAKTKHIFINENNKPVRIPNEFYDSFITNK